LNVKSRYAILLIILGLFCVLYGSVLRAENSPYTTLLFLIGLTLNFIGAIIFVINMYHNR